MVVAVGLGGLALGSSGVAGVSMGAVAAGLGVPAAARLVLTVVLIVAGAACRTRCFLPPVLAEWVGPRFRACHDWRERRRVLIGIFVLALALTEGAANEWIALARADGRGATAFLAGPPLIGLLA